MPGQASAPQLTIRGLSKRYQDSIAVQDVTFSVWPGEYVALLGPSGCGKTTTLRMIAGFVQPDEGQVLLEGRDITHLPPYRRNVGLVFQNYALFPHMSVERNVGFGLRMQRAPTARIRERVNWALDRVRMLGFEHRNPNELSGGQQQRVAVARVLANGASLLLLDEPFSNLDAKLRQSMQVELRELQQQVGVTAIHVTHDQEEAMAMSERLIVMNAARIEQDGSAEDLYIRPASQFVAGFIGQGNRLSGQIRGADSGKKFIEFEIEGGGTITASRGDLSELPKQTIAFVRPEDIFIGKQGSNAFGIGRGNILIGRVGRKVFLGRTTNLYVSINEQTELLVKLVSSAVPELGLETGVTKVDVWIPRERIRLLAA